jgi:hypothetical protein
MRSSQDGSTKARSAATLCTKWSFGSTSTTARGRDLLDGLGKRLREAEDQVLAGLDEAEDRQAFRTLLQHLSLYAATALDPTSADPCTTPAPEDC